MHQAHPLGAEESSVRIKRLGAQATSSTHPLESQHLEEAKVVHLLLALLVSADTVADDWAGRRHREGGSIDEDSS